MNIEIMSKSAIKYNPKLGKSLLRIIKTSEWASSQSEKECHTVQHKHMPSMIHNFHTCVTLICFYDLTNLSFANLIVSKKM
jgi:hypothetical protein